MAQVSRIKLGVTHTAPPIELEIQSAFARISFQVLNVPIAALIGSLMLRHG